MGQFHRQAWKKVNYVQIPFSNEKCPSSSILFWVNALTGFFGHWGVLCFDWTPYLVLVFIEFFRNLAFEELSRQKCPTYFGVLTVSDLHIY